MFDAPIGRVESGVEEKAEDGGELVNEMLLQQRDRTLATERALQQAAGPLEVLAARDREPVRRGAAGPDSGAAGARDISDAPRGQTGCPRNRHRAWPSAACRICLTTVTNGCAG
jgi:hypothetical protein